MNKDIYEIYRSKLFAIPDVYRLLKSHDYIVTGLAGSEPMEIMTHLHEVKDMGMEDLVLTNTLPMGNYEIFTNPELVSTVKVASWFYTGPLRKAHEQGHISFQPQHLHRAMDKRLVAMKDRRKVLMTTCAPMDKHGYLSLSIGNTYEMQLAREEGTIIIVEVNENYPRTFGDNQLHVSAVDGIVETSRPITELPVGEISDKDLKIGNYIADLIDDGSTIQLGIGGIPNAVAKALMGKKDLGIHTEMMTDGMVDLIHAGVITNAKKNFYRDRTVCTFALGSKKLYDFLDNNTSVVFMPGNWTNNPFTIAQNDQMVSINTTIEVDLTGQCCSESIGPRQFSGTGGQADTAIGAQYSKNGKSFIALYSTAQVRQPDGSKKEVSKIVSTLKEGAVVSLSRNDVDYVVTEYGVAHLKGQTIDERANRLINIAHPAFREVLMQEKEALMLY